MTEPVVLNPGPLDFVGTPGGIWVTNPGTGAPERELTSNGVYMSFADRNLVTIAVRGAHSAADPVNHPGLTAGNPAHLDLLRTLFGDTAGTNLSAHAKPGETIHVQNVPVEHLGVWLRLARHHDYLMEHPDRFVPMVDKWHEQAYALIVNPWDD